jgi:BTB/POZ domain
MVTISWEFPDLASNMNSKHKTNAKQALGTGWLIEVHPTSEDDHDDHGDTTTNNEPTDQSDEDIQTKQKKKNKNFTLKLRRKKLANSEPVKLLVRFAFSATTKNNNHSSSTSLIWSNGRLGSDFEVDDQYFVDDLVLFDDDDAAAINSMINDKDPALLDHTDHAGRGTLIITVHLKLLAARDSTTTAEPVWKPSKISPHPSLTKMRTDLMWTDISFLVSGRNFKAHRCILALHAPALLRLAEKAKVEEEDSSDTTTTTTRMIELPDVDSLSFENLLAYTYDGSPPHLIRTFDTVKSLLIAADRFECTSLKLYVEHYAVEEVLCAPNAADFLLLADSISCARLKEAALDEIAFVPEAIFQSDGWTRVMQSERLVMEVMRARYCKPTVEDKKRRAECMSVDTLRCHLAAKGLDVDGSRETLVKRFKAASSS